ncbi:MAG: hypothetical protein AAFW46_10445, partial [Pseudomonadota bacterium]
MAFSAPRPPLSEASIQTIREARLWWPVPRRGASRPERLLVSPSVFPGSRLARTLAEARDAGRAFDAVILSSSAGRALGPSIARRFGVQPLYALSDFAPEALVHVSAPKGAAPALWARLGGVDGDPEDPASGPASGVRFVDPWRGLETDAAEGLEAALFFARLARERRRPIVTLGFSPWKRANAGPFLTGPAGRPRHRRTESAALTLARRLDASIAVWGADRARIEQFERDLRRARDPSARRHIARIV